MEGLSGTSWRLPLLVDNGDTSDSSNGDSHQTPTGITIYNNTIVDSVGGGIYIGREDSSYGNSPTDIAISNNVVIGSQGILFGNDSDKASNSWSGNIAYATGNATANGGGILSDSELEVVSISPNYTKRTQLTTSDVGTGATASETTSSSDSDSSSTDDNTTVDNNSGTDNSSELLMNTLDASLPPSDNFDLSTWNLSVPINNGSGIATTIPVDKLIEGYELTDEDGKDYFWTNTSDGGMVFRDYVGGYKTSTGTSYSRTELREMLRGVDDEIDTKGVNKNNWVFSNAPDEQQALAGGVDGKMVATVAVNHVTSTGDSSQQGRVIVGQIHAASDEPLRLYYRLLPGHTKGSIYFAHEPSNGNDEEWYEMIGSRSTSADEPEDGVELDEKFSYEIDVQGTTMVISIMREGKDTISQEVDMSDSGYDGYYVDSDGDTQEDYMYFKAGVYNQNKSGDESDYVQATFYYLSKTHN
ncbi:polysaccharide lyase family 7 protein [Psychromonas sp.]|nr:polysaccharide lyase family 7 protein [Psychromonas sp.]